MSKKTQQQLNVAIISINKLVMEYGLPKHRKDWVAVKSHVSLKCYKPKNRITREEICEYSPGTWVLR